MLRTCAAIISDIEERLDAPTAKGLAQAVSRAIRDATLLPGDQLPPIRRVAEELMMSPTTVSAAWQLLARSGTIRSDGRRGTTVAPTTQGRRALQPCPASRVAREPRPVDGRSPTACCSHRSAAC